MDIQPPGYLHMPKSGHLHMIEPPMGRYPSWQASFSEPKEWLSIAGFTVLMLIHT